ncbi:molybdopterin-dependent oxidoreductase [Sphingomonas sp.]|uniref:molybdopterin-dependent oxidoreductase n=1 Tax=Sphingomonas sp. TaxID=28214 RepID=UPI002BFFCD7B|nr:molybdopterin-dependent oxidoreductase [Sphingomonas sp.]HWK36846.1 molybdopterin-dependent oxidoreductase [Sphingomonas sp.]
MILTRRALIGSLAATTLAGCDAIGRDPTAREILFSAENMHRWLHRTIGGRTALAREFRPDQISPIFRGNGNQNPDTPTYNAMAAGGFADWRIAVDGLVARPLALSMAQLRAMPARTQITRHDCVEGWSAIGKWHGVPLATVLAAAGLSDRARYIVFHCADAARGRPYYESLDLVEALHPQTILAWALNDAPLTVRNGAPVRLRCERQLGYKHAKYVERIEAVASLKGIQGGMGGYWEDVAGYDWYAGI